jgi:cyclase
MAIPEVRIIARLDIKGENVIKGVHLEGLRVVGKPKELVARYYKMGVHEILLMDAVASLYGRNQLEDIIRFATQEVFVPVAVGGGIRSVRDAQIALDAGADKVAVNTAALANPELISHIADKFGSQAMVLSIEAKQVRGKSRWTCQTDTGRIDTGRDVIEWVHEGVTRGAGEVLVTSVDRDGTRKGFDIELMKQVSEVTDVPLIASGGYGSPEHEDELLICSRAVTGIAIASVFHFDALDPENRFNSVL